MKHISSASFFTPIWTVEEEVRRRYAELALTLPYAQLRAHAKARLSSNPHWSIANIGPVLPRFFERHVKSTLPLGTRKQTAMAKRTAALIDELEQAATWCALAAAPVPKSLRAVLDDATLHCRRFDEIKVSNDQATQLRRRGCQNGAYKRHEDSRRLERLAIRFLRTKAPDGGWMSRAQAADTVSQHLTDLAIKHDLKVVKWQQTRATNVLRLTWADPRAKEVCRRHCRPRRSHRRHL